MNNSSCSLTGGPSVVFSAPPAERDGVGLKRLELTTRMACSVWRPSAAVLSLIANSNWKFSYWVCVGRIKPRQSSLAAKMACFDPDAEPSSATKLVLPLLEIDFWKIDEDIMVWQHVSCHFVSPNMKHQTYSNDAGLCRTAHIYLSQEMILAFSISRNRTIPKSRTK